MLEEGREAAGEGEGEREEAVARRQPDLVGARVGVRVRVRVRVKCRRAAP